MMDGTPVESNPMFSQEAEPYKAPPEVKPTLSAERLVFGELLDDPQIANQEATYPSSVKIVGEKYMQLRTDSPEDMETYSTLRMSTLARGASVITVEASPQWNPSVGTWHVLLKVQCRKFRSLKTTGLDPTE